MVLFNIEQQSVLQYCLKHSFTETVTQRYSVNKVFLNISQNSREKKPIPKTLF